MYSAPDGKDDVGFPPDLIHGNGPGELVQEASSGDSEARETHALGTHLERQDLDGIQGLKRSEAHRVDSTKNKHEGKGGGAGTLVCARIPSCWDRLLVKRSRHGHGKPDDTAARVGEEK